MTELRRNIPMAGLPARAAFERERSPASHGERQSRSMREHDATHRRLSCSRTRFLSELRSRLGRNSAVPGDSPGDLSADTVAGVSDVVAPDGLRTELKAEGSARIVRVEVLDTLLRLELFWLFSEDDVLTVRAISDSDGNVERDGGTEAGGNARGRSDSAE